MATTTTSKVYQFAQKVWEGDSAYRAQAQAIKAVTRQTKPNTFTVGGELYTAAPTARPGAIVRQFGSMPRHVPEFVIPPVENTDTQDTRASKIERWLKGVRSSTRYATIHPDKAYWLWFAEVGRGILRLQFDVERAKRGEFPFLRDAIDPELFAFRATPNGLMCATMQETRSALELYDELNGAYQRAYENPKRAADMEWGVPEVLKKAYAEYEDIDVELVQYWDKERWYMWVNEENVWNYEGKEGRPHLFECVPFQVGFCNGLPGSALEEVGIGLVKSTLPMMVNASKMLYKSQLAAEMLHFPDVIVKYTDGHTKITQSFPGATWDNVEKVDVIQLQPNEPLLAGIVERYDREINRAALPESSFGDAGRELSGYAYSQVNAGTLARNEDLLEDGTEAYVQHYQLLLWGVQTFTHDDYVSTLKLNKKEEEVYLKSFSTTTPTPNQPGKKTYSKVTLNARDVEGYTVVELDFLPQPPQDENAMYQQAQLAKDTGMPLEYIDREILKVESPEQVNQWRQEEALMQEPDWLKFMLFKWAKDKLNLDKPLGQEYAEYDASAPLREQLRAALGLPDPLQIQAEQQAQQMQAPMQQPPGMDLAAQMGMQQAGVPGVDMNGLDSSQLPPATQGQVPVDPRLAAMQASFNGGY